MPSRSSVTASRGVSSMETPSPRHGAASRSTSSSATRRTSRSWRRRRREAAPAVTAEGRTPTRRSSSWRSPGGSSARAADGSGSCCRSRSSPPATPQRVRAELDRLATMDVVMVVAAAGVRRPGPGVRAGVRRPPGSRRRPGRTLLERGRHGRARSAAGPVVAGRRDVRPARPAHGQLPRPVLRAGAGGHRGRHGSRSRHERPRRSRPLRLGPPRRDVRQATVPPPDRRARPLEPSDAPLGRRAAGAQGARGQPDPGDRGRRRPRRTMVAGRPVDHRPTDRRRRRLGARRRAHLRRWPRHGRGTGPAAPGCRRTSCASGRAGWPSCRGPPASSGRRSPRSAPATSRRAPAPWARRTASAPDDGGSTLGWWAERLPNGG